MNESHIRNVIEAAMLAAGKPLQPAELLELFDEGARPQLQDIHAALAALTAEYANRGIEIKETAAGFRIQVRREMANEISRLWPERPARYSRALLETLALIAYRQPITRAEIEAVRGVAVNPNILKTVIERNWVRVVGHRDVPGRPELLGTTREFLDYFGLKNLDELPPLAELKTIGDIKVQFDLPDPGPVGTEVGSSGDGAAGDGAGDSALPAAEGAASPSPADAAHGASAEVAAIAETGDGANSDVRAALEAGDGASSDASAALEADDGGASAALESADAASSDGRATAGDGADVDREAADRFGADGVSVGAPQSALHEAEEFAAVVDADLAAGDDDGSEDDELSAAGPTSSELVAGPRDLDD
jgi:segregation and condensation protein B